MTGTCQPTRAHTSYPDDWYVPTPPATQPAPSAQFNAAKPGLGDSVMARRDPYEAYWSRIPASRAGAMAWHPPIFPNSAGQFPLAAPAPFSVSGLGATQGIPGALVNLPATNGEKTYGLLGALANLPATDAPSYGLLGALANLPSMSPAPSPSFQPNGLPSGYGDQFAPPSLLPSLPNLSWPRPPAVLGDVSNMAKYADVRAPGGQFPFPGRAPFGAYSHYAPVAPPSTLNSQPADSAAFPFLQTAGLVSVGDDQSASQSLLRGLPNQHQPLQSNTPGTVEDISASSPPAASPTDSNDLGSITRVVRDASGRTIAIIHVQRAPSNASLSETDATPDVLHTGAKYAQINNAVTGNPVIDRTTDMLLAVLQESVLSMGAGWGARFGTAVHVDFANRVRKLDLPGIGQEGVEQGYHLDVKGFVQYGMAGSIRTDVTLRDPKDPDQKPIAVYDLKTGYAVLTPARVEEILKKVDTPGLWVIELQYRTGDAIDRGPPRR